MNFQTLFWVKLRLWRNVGISELTWAQDPEYAAPWLPGMLNRSVLSRLKLSGWSITCMASLKIKINTIINCFFFFWCHNSAGEHNALTLSMSMTKQLKGFCALYHPALGDIFDEFVFHRVSLPTSWRSWGCSPTRDIFAMSSSNTKSIS